jgi:hypothetical protein
MVDIAAVVFTIGYWVSGGNGFAVTPIPDSEGLFSMVLAGGRIDPLPRCTTGAAGVFIAEEAETQRSAEK